METGAEDKNQDAQQDQAGLVVFCYNRFQGFHIVTLLLHCTPSAYIFLFLTQEQLSLYHTRSKRESVFRHFAGRTGAFCKLLQKHLKNSPCQKYSFAVLTTKNTGENQKKPPHRTGCSGSLWKKMKNWLG